MRYVSAGVPEKQAKKLRGVAVVGERTEIAWRCLHPYRVVSGIKDARVGLQKPLFGGSHAWLLPNPSGLNAHHLPAALAQLFGELRVWATAEHARRQK